jgi:arabinogalactan endo-1,4-beta-galactosidase
VINKANSNNNLFLYFSKAIDMKPVKFILLLITSSSALLVGVDISHVELFESRGVIYRNEKGQLKDLFQLMKDNSINMIRLRLFTANEEQAQKDPYKNGHTLNLILKLARRAKTHGLEFMLDFHYSDTWADPEHQTKPLAWANLTFEQLNSTLYNYTRDSLLAFVEQDTIPQYIQIGNEITHGMLWPDGNLENDTNWTQFITLLDTASRAVRLVLKNKTKIVVHITSSTDWPYAKHFFDHVIGHIDFDIIGLSYYPFSHGTLNELRLCLEQLSLNYEKSIFIVETDYRWKNDEYLNKPMTDIAGFEETPKGQVQYAEYLANILNNLPGKKRETGLFWWATEYVTTKNYLNLGDFHLKSFFNASAVALPILQAFGQLGQSECCVKVDEMGKEKRRHVVLWIILCTFTISGILLIYRRYSKTKLNDL